MGIVTKPEVKSSFVVMKLDKDGNEIYRSAEIQNQITDYCYQRIFVAGGTNLPANGNFTKWLFRYLRLGKGTEEISPETTNLVDHSSISDGQSAGTPDNIVTTEVYGGESYRSMELTYLFGLGQFNSETFTQLGIYEGTGSGTLLCGQRLRDSAGDPVSLTILSDEQLVVKYTVRLKSITINDIIGNFSFVYEGITYDALLKCFSRDMISLTDMYSALPGPSTSSPQDVTRTQYQNRVEYVITQNRSILQNTGGISAINVIAGNNISCAQLTFTPPLPKTDQNTLTFSFRWTIKWRDL